jgi:hypothetical protein
MEEGRPAAASASPGAPVVEWVQSDAEPGRGVVRVSGVNAETLRRLADPGWTQAAWRRLMPVLAEQGSAMDSLGLPAMLGSYSVLPRGIEFAPLYPLEPGVRYRATFRPGELPGGDPDSAAIALTFELPRRPVAPTAYVRRVYPSADLLPENLLKFYIHFSAPMSMGGVYQHIRLLRETGEEVEMPFLEIDEELWNPARNRLTLFIDPGRIKRGVRPLEEVGPVFEEDHGYVLAIDAAWPDAEGQPLKAPFEKRFKVGPPDREPPEPQRWTIEPPPAGGREALTMEFGAPMDRALALRLIGVVGPDGHRIPGESSLEQEERRWKFTPTLDWSPGEHAVTVQTTIEDLAGNNIGKPFEVDVFETVRRWTNATVRLAFQIH